MSQELMALLEEWDGNGVVVRHDRPTGCWIFIALHDDTLGPPSGGTRMKVYPTPADGLQDALRLAEGMTYKWAGIDLAQGGGKAVLALSQPLPQAEREGLWERYGRLVESLRGAFLTGADLGMSAEAMAVVARKTQHVFGVNYTTGASEDPGPYTAHGVLRGLEAAVTQVFGQDGVRGRRILVEGLGGVGDPLARSLAEGGAQLLFSDLDTEKADALAQELGGASVPLDEVPSTPCDVYAPCAVGATLNPQTIPSLACRIVAGSANNQLLSDEDSARLHERGILYVPDYIINAGGAMAIVLMHGGLEEREALFRRVEGIGTTVAEILRDAVAANESPLVTARKHVGRKLEAARG